VDESVIMEDMEKKDQSELRRPKLFWFNLLLTVLLIVGLSVVPAPGYVIFALVGHEHHVAGGRLRAGYLSVIFFRQLCTKLIHPWKPTDPKGCSCAGAALWVILRFIFHFCSALCTLAFCIQYSRACWMNKFSAWFKKAPLG